MKIFQHTVIHRKYILPLTFLSILLFFSGCMTPQKVRHEIPLKKDSPSPRTLLEKIDLNDQYINALKAIADIEVKESGRKFPLRVALMLRKPSSMRAETIPIMGPPDFLASIHENTLKVYHPHEDELYIGKATPENLKNLIPFFPAGIQIEDLVSILLGHYPKVQGKEITLKEIGERNLYRIDKLAEGRLVQSLWIDRGSILLIGVTVISGENNTIYNVKYLEHIEKDGVTMPQKIIISEGENNTASLTISYSDLEPSRRDNDEISFDLQCHEGTKIRYLD